MPSLNASMRPGRIARVAVLLLAFLILGGADALAQENKRKEFQLFGTKEFRSSYKSLPKWVKVVDFEKGQSTFANIQNSKASRWVAIRDEAAQQGRMEQVKRVNSFFNQWPYRTDMEAWGKSDYWATPKEFLSKSGDCEDYAITKYYALKDMGVPIEDMRIVILNDSIRGLDHAVLAVDVDGVVYILDNVSNMVMTDDRLSHYKPYFSVNEYFRWVHMPPDTGDPGKSVIN